MAHAAMPQASRSTTRPARLAALNARRPTRGQPGAPSKPPRKSPWADIAPGRQSVRNTRRATLEAAGYTFDDRGFGLDTLGLGRFPNEVRGAAFEYADVQVLDILLSRKELNLRDHLALGGTCHAIRNMYTDEVWEALLGHRPMPKRGQHQSIDCHGDCVCERVLRTMATAEPGQTEHILVIGYDGVPQTPKEQAVLIVHDPERSLTQSQARRIYAVRLGLSAALIGRSRSASCDRLKSAALRPSRARRASARSGAADLAAPNTTSSRLWRRSHCGSMAATAATLPSPSIHRRAALTCSACSLCTIAGSATRTSVPRIAARLDCRAHMVKRSLPRLLSRDRLVPPARLPSPPTVYLVAPVPSCTCPVDPAHAARVFRRPTLLLFHAWSSLASLAYRASLLGCV